MTRPPERRTTTWPALAARSGGVELTNLGFGGSALLDRFTARAMKDTPADLISVKIGINLVNTDAMRLRSFTPAVHGFLDTIREGHPSVPLVVVSSIYCQIHEVTAGPSSFDPSVLGFGELRFLATGDAADVKVGKLTLNVIRDELARIVRQRAGDDPNLHYLHGRELYGESDFAELRCPASSTGTPPATTALANDLPDWPAVPVVPSPPDAREPARLRLAGVLGCVRSRSVLPSDDRPTPAKSAFPMAPSFVCCSIGKYLLRNIHSMESA